MPPETELFKNQPHDSPIEKISGRLIAFPSLTKVDVSGSCTRIASNLYITSRHVLTDFIDKYGASNGISPIELWIVHILSVNGPKYGVWKVQKTWFSPHSDLALLHTIPFNEDAIALKPSPCIGLELDPPALDERIIGFGYHSSTGRIVVDNNNTRHIEVDALGASSVGYIKEVHLEKRDSSVSVLPNTGG